MDAFRNVRIAVEIKALGNVRELRHAFFCGIGEAVMVSRQTNSHGAEQGTPVLRIIIRTVCFHDRGYDLSDLPLVEELSQAAHIFPPVLAIIATRLALKLTCL